MVRDAFGFEEYTDSKFKKLEQLLKDVKTPLYPTCNERYTKLPASLMLLQLKTKNHWTDKSYIELLEVLKDMLPERNVIPTTTYEAKKIVCPMGLKFEKLHACKDDCILFCGDYEAYIECPKCKASHYKQIIDASDDSEGMRRKVPRKVAWYFPIIPQLKRLFATARDAQQMTWHSNERTIDDYICHLVDGIQWQVIDFQHELYFVMS